MSGFDVIMNDNLKLREIVKAYNLAADKFITKVDTGLARSVVTYAELKAARELARTAGL